jgi:hypothetical protein
MRKNHRNRPGFRFCHRCDQELPANTEFFPRDKNRLLGIGYLCRPCEHEARKLRGDPRKNRWKTLMTDKQKAKKRSGSRAYYRKSGRANFIVSQYRLIDRKKGLACDLDATWFRENIECKPCFYCGSMASRNGCDRINNKLGHTKKNVVACCWTCNVVRGDRFSHAEMMILGQSIHAIKKARNGQAIHKPPGNA